MPTGVYNHHKHSLETRNKMSKTSLSLGEKHPGYRHGFFKKGYSRNVKRTLYSWGGMKRRCYNIKDNAYHIYGGSGIKVCDRWLNNFDLFYKDMGPRPNGKTLELIDYSKDYSKDNCRWVTKLRHVINRPLRKDNKSGFTGVRWNEATGSWRTEIRVNGKTKHIGLYQMKNKAIEARIYAEKTYWADKL